MKRGILNLTSLVACILLFGSYAQAQVIFYVEQPSSLSRSYELTYSSESNWGADLSDPANSILENVMVARDGSGADSLACQQLVTDLTGKIAILYRGDCFFSQKAKNAQDAGAIGVIIVNHSAGGPVGMAGADFADEIVIPVVMIGLEDGAALRPAIDAGELVVFIGTKTGKFDNDLGMFKSDVVIPKTQAIPVALASSGNMTVPLGAYITNYGNDDQTNVRLQASITDPSNLTIYSNISTSGVDISSGGYALVTLPAFTINTTTTGTYTITYTIVYDQTDDFPGDNEVASTFFVTEDFYAKTRIDSEDNYPILQGGYRYNEANGSLIKGCIMMTEGMFGGMKVHGISASASTSAEATLDGRFLEFDFWEYSSYTMAANGDLEFTGLSLLGGPILFDYDGNDLQSRFVTAKFNIDLENNKNYMACAATGLPDMFLGFDLGINYTAALANGEAVTAINNIAGANQWSFWGGDRNPAVIVHISDKVVFATAGGGTSSVNEMEASSSKIIPYPNPASEMVNIPLKEVAKGKVTVAIHDLSGKLVRTESFDNIYSKVISINAAGLENGVYYFQVNANNEIAAFPVVISK
jgi:hypothetical protein